MMKKQWLLVLAALVISGTAIVWAQSSFPIRLDSPPPETGVEAAVSSTGVAASGSALFLPPQSSAPFACDSSKHGWIYLQCTDTALVVFSCVVLCICQERVPEGTDAWTQLHNDSTLCADLAGTCP